MKYTRLLSCLIASVLVFTSTITVVKPYANPPESLTGLAVLESQHDHAAKQERPYPTASSKVTIFLHGLMVGHYNADKKNFKVAIVKKALGHVFDLNVYTPGTPPQCHRILLPEEGKWVFELRGDAYIPNNIEFFDPQKNLSKASDTDSKDLAILEDPAYILDVEGLHKKKLRRHKQLLGLFGNPLNQIFQFRHGTIKTEVRTNTLKIVNGSKEIQKAIAEVVGVEIDLQINQTLVLMDKKSKTVLWENSYSKSQGVETRLINLPHDLAFENRYCNLPYIEAARVCSKDIPKKSMDLSEFIKEYSKGLNSSAGGKNSAPNIQDPVVGTHFQFYYDLVFSVPKKERFELVNLRPYCIQVNKDGRPKEVIDTVPPYRCGMVLAGRKDVD